MKNLKSNQAITLVALIITIIVMLILVVVTVNIVINSGLLDTAKKAGQDWKRGEDTDNISSMYMGYTIAKRTTKDTTLSSYFQEQVEKGNIASAEADKGDVIITLANGNSYRVTEEGQISEYHVHNYIDGVCTICGQPEPQKVEIETIAAAPTTYYGKTVNYTADVDNTITWQLFYVDDTNDLIYLIAKDRVDITKTTNLKTELNDVSTTDNNVNFSANASAGITTGIYANSAYNYSSTYPFNSNSTYNTQIKSLISYFNDPLATNYVRTTDANIRCTIFMLTSSKWSEYLDDGGAEHGAWVIGGPTLDLFATAYNQYYNGQTIANKITHIYYDYLTTGTQYGYYIGSADSPSTSTSTGENKYYLTKIATTNGGVYMPNFCYWMSSPCGKWENGMCYIDGSFTSINARRKD